MYVHVYVYVHTHQTLKIKAEVERTPTQHKPAVSHTKQFAILASWYHSINNTTLQRSGQLPLQSRSSSLDQRHQQQCREYCSYDSTLWPLRLAYCTGLAQLSKTALHTRYVAKQLCTAFILTSCMLRMPAVCGTMSICHCCRLPAHI